MPVYMMVIHDRKLEILLLERAVAFSFPFDLYQNWILYANSLTQKTIYSHLFFSFLVFENCKESLNIWWVGLYININIYIYIYMFSFIDIKV